MRVMSNLSADRCAGLSRQCCAHISNYHKPPQIQSYTSCPLNFCAGGLLPDVSCSDYPHAGVPSDMDKCIATAIGILGKQHEVIPPLYASSPGASTDGGGS